MKKFFLQKQALVFLALCIAAATFLAFMINQMQKVSAQSASPTTTTANDSSTSVPNIFSRQLSLGMTGQDIQALQQILNYSPDMQVSTTGNGSPGNETTYFGARTQTALIKFQQKYSLPPTGVADTQTEEVLSTLYDAANVASSSGSATSSVATADMTLLPASSNGGKPQIKNISPSDVSEGDTITITGDNFDASNTIKSTFDNFPHASSTDGRIIKVTVHSVLEQQLNKKLSFIKDSTLRKEVKKSALLFMQKDFAKALIEGIPFKIKVENAGGDSNSVTIYYKLN